MSRGERTKSIKNNISFLYFFIITPVVVETMFLFLFFHIEFRNTAGARYRRGPPPPPLHVPPRARGMYENVGFK